jgi:hypothetical protein
MRATITRRLTTTEVTGNVATASPGGETLLRQPVGTNGGPGLPVEKGRDRSLALVRSGERWVLRVRILVALAGARVVAVVERIDRRPEDVDQFAVRDRLVVMMAAVVVRATRW